MVAATAVRTRGQKRVDASEPVSCTRPRSPASSGNKQENGSTCRSITSLPRRAICHPERLALLPLDPLPPTESSSPPPSKLSSLRREHTTPCPSTPFRPPCHLTKASAAGLPCRLLRQEGGETAELELQMTYALGFGRGLGAKTAFAARWRGKSRLAEAVTLDEHDHLVTMSKSSGKDVVARKDMNDDDDDAEAEAGDAIVIDDTT
ncbi:hypothetical protein BCR39DRAFT_506375 [Naematelia encephala]|uniref:Uncharacterized protein n=1 Tax=Naematelia encephala TaxID=71784 RepID=A0A1Y2AX45_9TREE|nr:hypothetical protein BCR39DRAFT_506375 [Naematelia encephala]